MKKWIVLLCFFCTSALAQDASEAQEQAALLQEKILSALVEQGDVRAALPLLDEAVALFDKTYGGEKRRLYAAHSTPETLVYLTQAANAGQDAVVIPGMWADFWYWRGYVHIDLQDVDAGKKDLDRALELAPLHAMARNERGHYYTLQKDWDKAIADFQQVIDENVIDDVAARKTIVARAQRGIAYIFIERGQWDEARALYQQILADNPDDVTAKQQLQYIRAQRDGEMPPPSFLAHAANHIVGEHTHAWAAGIRPDTAQAKSPEEYADLAFAARSADVANMTAAVGRDCVAHFGEALADACRCATEKVDYAQYYALETRARQTIRAHLNRDFNQLFNQYRAIEQECGLPPMKM